MSRPSAFRSVGYGLLALLAAPLAAGGAIAPDYHVPVPEVRTLANGLRVVVFHDTRLDLVQMLIRVPGGVDAEPSSQAGVASLTAQCLSRGTTSRDAATLARDFSRIGATVQASANRDAATISGAFVASQLGAGLELVSDMLVNPLFPDADVRRLANQSASTLLQLHQNPAATAEEQVWPLALENRPVGRPLLGTTGSLLNLGREQVRVFHRDRYRPDRAVLILAGDVTMDHAMALANEWFGRWTGRVADPPAAAPAAAGPRVRIIDMPGARECEVRLALAVPGRRAPDEAARAIAAQMIEIDLADRARRVPASALRSDLALLRDRGVWTMGGSAPADSAGALAARLKSEMRRRLAATPDAEQVSAARTVALGTYPLRFETLAGVANQWSTADSYGLGADYLERVPRTIGALTAADLAAALKASGSADRAVILAVGPAAKLKRALAPFGTSEVLVLDAAATVTPVADAPGSPEDVARGRRVIDQAIAAHGGLAKLKGIHDSVIDAEITLNMQGNQLNGRMRQIRKDPDKMVYTTSFQGIDTRQVLNGRQAWTSLGANTPAREADSASVRAMRGGFESDLPHLLLSAADSTSRVTARPAERVGDVLADAVDVTPRGGEPRRMFFDPASHRLIAMDVAEQMSRTGAIPSRRFYRDPRTVDGVVWPHEEERLLAGNPFMTIRITEIHVNIGVDDREFARPGAPGPAPGR